MGKVLTNSDIKKYTDKDFDDLIGKFSNKNNIDDYAGKTYRAQTNINYITDDELYKTRPRFNNMDQLQYYKSPYQLQYSRGWTNEQANNFIFSIDTNISDPINRYHAPNREYDYNWGK